MDDSLSIDSMRGQEEKSGIWNRNPARLVVEECDCGLCLTAKARRVQISQEDERSRVGGRRLMGGRGKNQEYCRLDLKVAHASLGYYYSVSFLVLRGLPR
jgi:hypothetical protein